jgi:hypothetical protein
MHCLRRPSYPHETGYALYFLFPSFTTFSGGLMTSCGFVISCVSVHKLVDYRSYDQRWLCVYP